MLRIMSFIAIKVTNIWRNIRRSFCEIIFKAEVTKTMQTSEIQPIHSFAPILTSCEFPTSFNIALSGCNLRGDGTTFTGQAKALLGPSLEYRIKAGGIKQPIV